MVALIDLHSRHIVAWELSNSLDAAFCIAMLKGALLSAIPEIINTDQGSQFTSKDWIKTVKESKVQVSMDGVGRWADNVYIERFWRSLKYEEAYLMVYENVQEARQGIASYIEFYNHERPHSSLGYETPANVYLGKKFVPPLIVGAKKNKRKDKKNTTKETLLFVQSKNMHKGDGVSLVT